MFNTSKKNTSRATLFRSIILCSAVFIAIFAGAIFLFPQKTNAAFCFSGNCYLQGPFCNNSGECMGAVVNRGANTTPKACGTSGSADGCVTGWWDNTVRSGNPQVGSYCIGADCVSARTPEILNFSANNQQNYVEIDKGDKVDFRWIIDSASSIQLSNIPTDINNDLNRKIGDIIRGKNYRIDLYTGPYYPQSDTTYTVRAYNPFAPTFITSKDVVVKVQCNYGCCMKDVMKTVEKESNDNWGARIACGGLKYTVQAAVAAFTANAPIVPGAAGGIVGGLCDAGVKIITLNKYKVQCDDKAPPEKTPEQMANIFFRGFLKELFTQAFSSFFHGLFGGFFSALSCNPWIQGFMDFFSNVIGGAIGTWISGLLFGSIETDPNDPLTWIGAAIGGGIGGAIGYEVGTSAGSGLSSFLGFVKVTPASCLPGSTTPKKCADGSDPPCKTTYVCNRNISAPPRCSVGIGDSTWGDPLSCEAACAIDPQLPIINAGGKGSLEVGGGLTKTGLNIAGLIEGHIRAIDCVATNILVATASSNVFGSKKTDRKDTSGKDIVEVAGGPFRSTEQKVPMAYILGYLGNAWNQPPLDWTDALWDILTGIGFEAQDIVPMLEYNYSFSHKNRTITTNLAGHAAECFAH